MAGFCGHSRRRNRWGSQIELVWVPQQSRPLVRVFGCFSSRDVLTNWACRIVDVGPENVKSFFLPVWVAAKGRLTVGMHSVGRALQLLNFAQNYFNLPAILIEACPQLTTRIHPVLRGRNDLG